MDAARARKLADRISQIVAEMLKRRIKDPRLGFATITEARLTNDLREATVYYTVLGTDVVVKHDAFLERAIAHDHVYVGPNARLRGCVVGRSTDLRGHARAEEGVVLGDEHSHRTRQIGQFRPP